MINKRNILILFLGVIITTALFLIYRETQPALTYAACKLCDGNQYLSIYEYFRGHASEYKATFPYYSRIMIPVLAALLPGEDAVVNFQILNLTFSILAVISLYYLWKRLDIPLHLIATGLFWLLFHWTGLLRLNAMDPVTVDVPTYLIQTLFILIVISRRQEWLYLFGPIAVIQRESAIVLLLVLLLFGVIHNKIYKEKTISVYKVFIALVITILVKYLVTKFLPPADEGKSSVRLVLFYIREVLTDPFKVIRWVTGIFMAYGAFIIAALLSLRKKLFDSSLFLFLTMTSVCYLLLGIIAGGDSTRIVFLGFPFIMTWIFLALRERPPILPVVALLLSLFLMRLLDVIPDPGRNFPAFASWYPEFADKAVVGWWGMYLLLCLTICFLVNKKLQ